MRVGVRKLRRGGQQGTLRVALSTDPILHRLKLRLDVSLGPQSSAADPNSVCARRSGNTPPCFRGRLLRLGCDRGGGLCVIWWCGGRGRSGSCCLCLGDLDTGSLDWVLDDEGLVEPLGFVEDDELVEGSAQAALNVARSLGLRDRETADKILTTVAESEAPKDIIDRANEMLERGDRRRRR